MKRSYHDKATGQTKHKIDQTLGYVDELEKEYPDPIAHFKEVARRMTEEAKQEKNVTLHIDIAGNLAFTVTGIEEKSA